MLPSNDWIADPTSRCTISRMTVTRLRCLGIVPPSFTGLLGQSSVMHSRGERGLRSTSPTTVEGSALTIPRRLGSDSPKAQRLQRKAGWGGVGPRGGRARYPLAVPVLEKRKRTRAPSAVAPFCAPAAQQCNNVAEVRRETASALTVAKMAVVNSRFVLAHFRGR